jgi:hypothetical protein
MSTHRRSTWIPRLHLIELHEQPWVPEAVRRMATDYLHTVLTMVGPFKPLAPRLLELVRASGETTVVDLCSGGSGTLLQLLDGLRERGVEARVIMTDLYPNLPAFERAQEASGGRLGFEAEPVDARRVPDRLRGARTIFNALHHFRPAEARAILADAAAKGAPILVAEASHRSALGLLGTLGIAPTVLLFMPFVRPVTPLRLLLTYVVPVAPALIFFDGLVSVLRCYRADELLELARGLGGKGYVWEAGETRVRSGMVVTWLAGRPAAGAGQSAAPAA